MSDPESLLADYMTSERDTLLENSIRFRAIGRTAEEMAKIPTYYVMHRDKGMAETAAEQMPSPAPISPSCSTAA